MRATDMDVSCDGFEFASGGMNHHVVLRVLTGEPLLDPNWAS